MAKEVPCKCLLGVYMATSPTFSSWLSLARDLHWELPHSCLSENGSVSLTRHTVAECS